MPLESYSVGKTIGKGTYGEVSLAKHKKDGRQFVIKKIDLHSASCKERNFAQQEVQILSKMKHPNIVAYRESFQDESGFLYIVMGYCEGGDLYRKLKEQAEKGELLPETQIVEWFVQIAMGLQYMHDRNILHRDLKTQNIFLTKSKIIKLGDLGIARVLENTCDMATTLIGTPYYMSPEIFSNKPYNHKSDIWALGCCVYEMTSLKHAFNAKDMNSLVYKILRGKTPPMPKQYTQDLCQIIRSMLAYDPAERPSVSKILRQPFIKLHIMMFLEGTKLKKKQNDEKVPRSAPPRRMQASKDSGVGESFETESQAAATASAVEIELVSDEKERRRPYEVRNERAKRASKQPKPRPEGHKEPRAHDVPVRQSARDRRRKSQEESNSHIVVEASRIESQAPSRDSKEAASRAALANGQKRRSSLEKHQARSNRPLPPPPALQEGMFSPSQRKLSDGQRPAKQASQAHRPRNPELSAGTPNQAARKKRRQRMKEEDIRRSRLSNSSVSTPRSVDSPDGFDSIDGQSVTESRASTSEEDAPNSDTEELQSPPARPRPPHRSGSDIGNLIETLQQTLSLGQRPGSERSSPEDSVDGSIAEEKESGSPNNSGKLRNRIEKLRDECLRGLGDQILRKAYRIIDEEEEENVELALVQLMGRDRFDMYGGMIWQLKFCEEFRV